MIHMPAAALGKSWRLAHPYHGPYKVSSVTPTNIEAKLVDNVNAKSILVAVNRIKPCAANLPDTTWTGAKKKRKYQRKSTVNDSTSTSQKVVLLHAL